jgi:photosynthetic reaction center cytochrome c subunit
MLFIRTPVEADQIGYRGVAMEQVEFADDKLAKAAMNVAPEEVYELEPDDGTAERAGEIYENVQVLGHLSDDNFNRFMAQITEWVSPEQGCGYCHNNADGEIENFAGDYNYAKLVSRRMIQMTQDINANYDSHVNSIAAEGAEASETRVAQDDSIAGVNCYTCHRGKNVPEYLWFKDPGTELEPLDEPFMGARNGQNLAVEANGYTDLNTDPFSAYILRNEPARVIYDEASIGDNNESLIMRTEHTYSFMIHMSKALGVNCTYCHNSRNFSDWSQSPVQRTTAWYGIQMSRHLNVDYLVPLGPTYPEHRLGELGDAPKANCATCHQGNYKPLNGADMISGFPSLWAPGPAEMQDPALSPEEVEAALNSN